MTSISLKEARKRLGKLVKAAEHGETVMLTRRGRNVARIVSAALEKPARLPDLSEFRASIAVKGKGLSRTVVDLRSEERY